MSHITGIDLVDRSGQAADFGIDHFESVIGRNWSTDDSNRDAFDLVVEAVGHQVGTMQDAINVVAPGGTVLYFGNPDDRYYPLDFGRMMDKDVTLVAGRTPSLATPGHDSRPGLRREIPRNDEVVRDPCAADRPGPKRPTSWPPGPRPGG